MQLFKRFRRITDSTSYLPEVDGLRFLAIFLVVAVLHITNYLEVKGAIEIHSPYWVQFVQEGGFGVPLFFMISGFILSLPFARHYLKNERRVPLRNYYLRRLVRLEPPYLLVLIVLFLIQVYVLHMYSLEQHWPHLLASMFYVHNLVYQSFSTVLPISWSLEVEVQFYIIAPLFFRIYHLSPTVRRSILVLVMIVNAVVWNNDWGFPQLLKYLHFFAAGMLITDLYLDEKRWLVPAGKWVGVLAIAGVLFIPSLDGLVFALLRFLCAVVLMYCVLREPVLKRIFSLPVLAGIGGMCYSIYLLHLAVISAAGRLVTSMSSFVQFVYLLLAVLVISAVFYLFIERPFMKFRRRS